MAGILSTLAQDEYWYGRDGRPYRIEEMEQSHRVNVQNFLLRRADDLAEHRAWAERTMMAQAPECVFEEWLHSLNQPAKQWLMETPFMQALQRSISEYASSYSAQKRVKESGPRVIRMEADPVEDEEDETPVYRAPVELRVTWRKKYVMSTRKNAKVAHYLDIEESRIVMQSTTGEVRSVLRAICGWATYSWRHGGTGGGGLHARLADSIEDRRICGSCERVREQRESEADG